MSCVALSTLIVRDIFFINVVTVEQREKIMILQWLRSAEKAALQLL